MRKLLSRRAPEEILAKPAAKMLLDRYDFGSVRYGLGIDPQSIRLSSIDAFEQVDLYTTDVHLRNGRTVKVTWSSVDELASVMDRHTTRRFIRVPFPGFSESFIS